MSVLSDFFPEPPRLQTVGAKTFKNGVQGEKKWKTKSAAVLSNFGLRTSDQGVSTCEPPDGHHKTPAQTHTHVCVYILVNMCCIAEVVVEVQK